MLWSCSRIKCTLVSQFASHDNLESSYTMRHLGNCIPEPPRHPASPVDHFINAHWTKLATGGKETAHLRKCERRRRPCFAYWGRSRLHCEKRTPWQMKCGMVTTSGWLTYPASCPYFTIGKPVQSLHVSGLAEYQNGKAFLCWTRAYHLVNQRYPSLQWYSHTPEKTSATTSNCKLRTSLTQRATNCRIVAAAADWIEQHVMQY